jgi:hypothetical protein
MSAWLSTSVREHHEIHTGQATRNSHKVRTRSSALMQALPSRIAAFTKAGVTSDAAVRTIAKAATDRRPRTHCTIGARATFLIRASRFLPGRALDRMTSSDLRKNHPARTTTAHHA